MPRLTETEGLTDLQRDILRTVRDFTEAEIIPVASDLDHSDTYPDQIGEGTAEIQKMIIGRRLLERFAAP